MFPLGIGRTAHASVYAYVCVRTNAKYIRVYVERIRGTQNAGVRAFNIAITVTPRICAFNLNPRFAALSDRTERRESSYKFPCAQEQTSRRAESAQPPLALAYFLNVPVFTAKVALDTRVGILNTRARRRRLALSAVVALSRCGGNVLASWDSKRRNTRDVTPSVSRGPPPPVLPFAGEGVSFPYYVLVAGKTRKTETQRRNPRRRAIRDAPAVISDRHSRGDSIARIAAAFSRSPDAISPQPFFRESSQGFAKFGQSNFVSHTLALSAILFISPPGNIR